MAFLRFPPFPLEYIHYPKSSISTFRKKPEEWALRGRKDEVSPEKSCLVYVRHWTHPKSTWCRGKSSPGKCLLRRDIKKKKKETQKRKHCGQSLSKIKLIYLNEPRKWLIIDWSVPNILYVFNRIDSDNGQKKPVSFSLSFVLSRYVIFFISSPFFSLGMGFDPLLLFIAIRVPIAQLSATCSLFVIKI